MFENGKKPIKVRKNLRKASSKPRLPIYGEDLKRRYQNHTIGQLAPHPSDFLLSQPGRSSFC